MVRNARSTSSCMPGIEISPRGTFAMEYKHTCIIDEIFLITCDRNYLNINMHTRSYTMIVFKTSSFDTLTAVVMVYIIYIDCKNTFPVRSWWLTNPCVTVGKSTVAEVGFFIRRTLYSSPPSRYISLSFCGRVGRLDVLISTYKYVVGKEIPVLALRALAWLL